MPGIDLWNACIWPLQYGHNSSFRRIDCKHRDWSNLPCNSNKTDEYTRGKSGDAHFENSYQFNNVWVYFQGFANLPCGCISRSFQWLPRNWSTGTFWHFRRSIGTFRSRRYFSTAWAECRWLVHASNRCNRSRIHSRICKRTSGIWNVLFWRRIHNRAMDTNAYLCYAKMYQNSTVTNCIWGMEKSRYNGYLQVHNCL